MGGWHPDPWGVHEYRWHDEAVWTAHVSDAGQVTFDPPPPNTPITPAPASSSPNQPAAPGGSVGGLAAPLVEWAYAVRDAGLELRELRRGQLRWDGTDHAQYWWVYEREFVAGASPNPLGGTERVAFHTSGNYERSQGWVVKETNDSRRSWLTVSGPGWTHTAEMVGQGETFMLKNPSKMRDGWMGEFEAVFTHIVASAPSAWAQVRDELGRARDELDRLIGDSPQAAAVTQACAGAWARTDRASAGLLVALLDQLPTGKKAHRPLPAIEAALGALEPDEVVRDAVLCVPGRKKLALVVVTAERVLLVDAGGVVTELDRQRTTASSSMLGVKVGLRTQRPVTVQPAGAYVATWLVGVIEGTVHGRVAGLGDVAEPVFPASDREHQPDGIVAVSLPEQLEQLAQLREQGVLDDASSPPPSGGCWTSESRPDHTRVKIVAGGRGPRGQVVRCRTAAVRSGRGCFAARPAARTIIDKEPRRAPGARRWGGPHGTGSESSLAHPARCSLNVQLGHFPAPGPKRGPVVFGLVDTSWKRAVRLTPS